MNFLTSKLIKRIPFTVGFIGGILLLIVGHQPNDDAYITFRHSKNFALYGQLVWNVDDEKVLGSSTPFFSFFLGILGYLFGIHHIPFISLMINGILIGLTGWVIYLIVKTITESDFLSFWIVLLVSINSYIIRIHSYGFEFALFTFLIFFNLYLFFNSKTQFEKHIALILPNILILTRIEGVFIYPLVLIKLYQWLKKKWILPIHIFLPFLFVIYVIFSFFYYDQILPQSIYAKRDFQRLFPLFSLSENMLENLSQRQFIVKEFLYSAFFPILRYGTEEATFLLEKYSYTPVNFLFNRNTSLLNYSILLAIVVIYFFFIKKRFLELYYFFYIPFFLIFVFYTIRVESWYFPPLIVSYLLFLCIGTYFLLEIILNLIEKYYKIPYRKFISHIFMFIFILSWISKNFYVINQKTRPFDEFRGILYPPGMRDNVEWERYFVYKDTIDFLKKNQLKGTIASPEIGVMGFFYEDSLLDLFGLCSKKVIKYYYENYYNNQKEDYTVYVLKKENPEFFISGMDLSKESPLKDFLLKNYQIIFRHPKYQVFGEPLYVWKRKN